MLEKLCPILPTRDIAKAEAFWRALGFSTVYMDIGEYLLMKRDGAEVHFALTPDLDPYTTAGCAYLRPSNIKDLHEEWSKLGLPDKGIPRYEALAEKPWGMAELALVDPDGNLIRAGQEIPLG